MTEKDIKEIELTPQNFKDYVLFLEKNNLKNIQKEDKKNMVSKIIRAYEEAKKNDNK